MKDLINELFSKRTTLWDQCYTLINQLEAIEKINNLSVLRSSISKLKADVANIDIAIKSLQSICDHQWGSPIYDRPYKYYNCTICGACKEDC